MSATTKDLLIEKIEVLSVVDQQKVLEFINSLETSTTAEPKRKSLLGRFADLGVSISKEEIDQARRESWSNFPRDIS